MSNTELTVRRVSVKNSKNEIVEYRIVTKIGNMQPVRDIVPKDQAHNFLGSKLEEINKYCGYQRMYFDVPKNLYGLSGTRQFQEMESDIQDVEGREPLGVTGNDQIHNAVNRYFDAKKDSFTVKFYQRKKPNE